MQYAVPTNDLGDGNFLVMQTAKGGYLEGELIEITGNAPLKSYVKIILNDPNGTTSDSATTFNDRNGYFTAQLKIPKNAMGGIWKVVGTSGIYQRELDVTVFTADEVHTRHCCLISNYTNPVILDSPLKQFRSGIVANDVKCNQDLQLVIKSEDGSPACVKLQTAQKLVERGWGSTNNEGLSESNCRQFHTIPETNPASNEIPVLILQQNSIGCAKITFTILSSFNNTNDCIGCNSQIVKISQMLSIGKYNFSRHGNLLSGSATDYTHSFQITAVPETVDLTHFPIGSNFTTIFMIKPLPNATGFYDYSIVKPVCNAYPLVVGYNSDQVNSSDFSEDLGFMQNHPCHYGPYGYSPVQVSGISYVQMKLG